MLPRQTASPGGVWGARGDGGGSPPCEKAVPPGRHCSVTPGSAGRSRAAGGVAAAGDQRRVPVEATASSSSPISTVSPGSAPASASACSTPSLASRSRGSRPLVVAEVGLPHPAEQLLAADEICAVGRRGPPRSQARYRGRADHHRTGSGSGRSARARATTPAIANFSSRSPSSSRPRPRGGQPARLQFWLGEVGQLASLGTSTLSARPAGPVERLVPASLGADHLLVRGQLHLDRVEVGDRVAARFEWSRVEHVHQSRAALDMPQEVMPEALPRWRLGSAPARPRQRTGRPPPPPRRGWGSGS